MESVNGKIKIVTSADPLYSKVLELRNEILRKPIGLNLFEEDLSAEKEDVTFVYEEEGHLFGCVLLRRCEQNKLKLRQMAVDSGKRGKNVGRHLVEAAEAYARELKVAEIILHGRTVSLGFYLKCGYQIVSEEFLELGVPHYALKKEMRSV